MLYIPLENINIKTSTNNILVGVVKNRDGVDNATMPSYIGNGQLVGRFNGVKTFLNYLKDEMPRPKTSSYDSSEDKSRDSFQTFNTYKEALDTYMNNPSSLVKFDEIEDVIQVFDEIGKDVDYDITGDFIDIARFMEGIPEVFGSLHNGLVRRYRANITINLSWIHSATKDAVNERLKKVLSLVDWLEINNIRCSITAISSQECSHLEINVKDYDETLDLRELAIVSHSDFLRRMVFRFDEWSNTINGGYGSAYCYGSYIDELPPREAFEEFNIFVGSRVDDKCLYEDKFRELRESILRDIEEGKLTDKKVLNERF